MNTAVNTAPEESQNVAHRSIETLTLDEAQAQALTEYAQTMYDAFEDVVVQLSGGTSTEAPLTKSDVEGAFGSFFSAEAEAARKHTGSALIAHIHHNDKNKTDITAAIADAHKKMMEHVKKTLEQTLQILGDDFTVGDFTETLTDKLQEMGNQHGTNILDQEEFREAAMARFSQNIQALHSLARNNKKLPKSLPKNETKQQGWIRRTLAAIPLAAFVTETTLSTMGVGKNWTLLAESVLHNPDPTDDTWLMTLLGNPTGGAAAALAASVTINGLLKYVTKKWNTARKNKALRNALTDEECKKIEGELAEILRAKTYPKGWTRGLLLLIGATLAFGGAGHLVGVHARGKLGKATESRMVLSQVDGIVKSTEAVRQRIAEITGQFDTFQTNVQGQTKRWLDEEGKSGKGPGYYGKGVVIHGQEGIPALESVNTTSINGRQLATNILTQLRSFQGGDGDIQTGYDAEVSTLIGELKKLADSTVKDIAEKINELAEMQKHPHKTDRQKVITIVDEIAALIGVFGDDLENQQSNMKETSKVFADFIGQINALVNAAYASRAPVDFKPDTNLPSIDTKTMIADLLRQKPEFKYHSAEEIEELMQRGTKLDGSPLFTPEEAEEARWGFHVEGVNPLGWLGAYPYGITVEILLRILAFGGGIVLMSGKRARNLSPKDHIEGEKTKVELIDGFTELMNSEEVKKALPFLGDFEKPRIESALMSSMEKWKVLRDKQNYRSETISLKKRPFASAAQRVGRILKLAGAPVGGVKNLLTNVQAEGDEQLQRLRDLFAAIQHPHDAKRLDPAFIDFFIINLLGDQRSATELRGALGSMQTAIRKHPNEATDLGPTLTRGELTRIFLAHTDLRNQIATVENRVDVVVDELKRMQDADINLVEAWGTARKAELTRIKNQMPNNRVMDATEQNGMDKQIRDINNAITITETRGSVVNGAEEA